MGYAISNGWPAGPQRDALLPESLAHSAIRFNGFLTLPAPSRHSPAQRSRTAETVVHWPGRPTSWIF
jgi:hypothetical protein